MEKSNKDTDVHCRKQKGKSSVAGMAISSSLSLASVEEEGVLA